MCPGIATCMHVDWYFGWLAYQHQYQHVSLVESKHNLPDIEDMKTHGKL